MKQFFLTLIVGYILISEVLNLRKYGHGALLVGNWFSPHLPTPRPFLSYCHVCVTHSKLSLGDTHGINSFHLSFHTWSAAYIPLSPNKMKHTVLVFTWPVPCFLCWTLAISMRGSGIMPDSKVVVGGVCAEVTVPFPPWWMQVWRGAVFCAHSRWLPWTSVCSPQAAPG